MSVRICLLVTDDPDDHEAISEALSEVSENTVLLNVLDSNKALLLLQESSYRPDFIILDLSMHGIRINPILKTLRKQPKLSHIPTVVFGEESAMAEIEEPEGLDFFRKDYNYSGLRTFLKRVMDPV